MSLTMRSQNLAVSLTPVKDGLNSVVDTSEESSVVSLTPVMHSKTAKVSLTGVIDIGEKFHICVNDTGNACFASVIDTSKAPK